MWFRSKNAFHIISPVIINERNVKKKMCMCGWMVVGPWMCGCDCGDLVSSFVLFYIPVWNPLQHEIRMNQWTNFSVGQSKQQKNMGFFSVQWLYKKQICWMAECPVCKAIRQKSNCSSISAAISNVMKRNCCCQRNFHENLLYSCFPSIPLVYFLWLLCLSFCFQSVAWTFTETLCL